MYTYKIKGAGVVKEASYPMICRYCNKELPDKKTIEFDPSYGEVHVSCRHKIARDRIVR